MESESSAVMQVRGRRRFPLMAAVHDHHGPTPFLSKSLSRLQREGKLSGSTKHRTCKNLNNIIEADQGSFKRVIRPTQALDDKDGRRYHQDFRGHADGSPRPLPHLQTAGQRRGALHQQFVLSSPSPLGQIPKQASCSRQNTAAEPMMSSLVRRLHSSAESPTPAPGEVHSPIPD